MKTSLICEYGTNWNDLDDILWTCDGITKAGGIPKGQLWDTDLFCNKRRNPKHWKVLRKYELKFEWVAEILRRFPGSFFSVFDENSIGTLEMLGVEAYKIASPDCVYEPLVRAVAHTWKPMYVSVGGATLDEIRKCVEWIRDVDSKYYQRLTLMSCVVSYPCKNAMLGDLRDRIAGSRIVPWGYSSHSMSKIIPAIGVALGASAVEVHVKNKVYDSPDDGHSFLLPELEEIVEHIKVAEENMGTGERPLPCEIENLRVGRRKSDGRR